MIFFPGDSVVVARVGVIPGIGSVSGFDAGSPLGSVSWGSITGSM